MRLLISGYGGASGHTAGVYDTEAARFVWESGLSGISFMCAGGDMMFGAGEYPGHGKVYLFKSSPAYHLADTLDVPGGALCHIAYSPRAGMLAGACYENGDFFAVPVTEDGFGTMAMYLRQGADTPAGTLSRAHCAVYSEDERFIYAANIALDRVYRYEITAGGLCERGYVSLPEGVGPRHILPLGDCLYIMTEYSNELITLRTHATAPESRVSTLPDGFAYSKAASFGSGLCFLPGEDGQRGFIYTANRGANTVAVFAREPGGGLRKVWDWPCPGDWPRHIAVVAADGGAPYLAVASERSGYVSLCPLDPSDGQPGAETYRIPFEGASYVGTL